MGKHFIETRELSHIVDLFQKNLIYMPGGQDLEENNLIILNDEITSFSFDELNMCVRYLVQLNNRPNSTFAFIINNQNNFIDQKKTLLHHLQVILEKRLLVVYHITKPTKRKMSFKKEKNQFPFKYIEVNMDRLKTYIKPSDLPTELGGDINYRHHIWIQHHLAFEKYRRQVSVLCGQFKGHMSRLNLTSSASTAGDVIRERRLLHPQIVEPAERLINNGQQLYREIRSGQGPRFSTPMLDGVQSLVSTLAAAVGRLQSVLADRLARLQIRPQTSQLNILMRTIIDWINGSGRLPEELGQDLRQTNQLQDDHSQLKTKSMDVFAAYAELCNKMASSNHGDLTMQKAFVDNSCSGFAVALERRSVLLDLASSFHQPAEALYKIFTNVNWPTLEEITKIEDISVYITDLDVEFKVIDDLLTSTMEASHAYIDTLETRYPICVNNTDVCDRVLHAVHVLRQAYATYELHAGVYRIRLAFIDKLHFTRNQLEQVYEWINELSSNMLQDRKASEMILLRDTADNVYAYTEELLSLNLLLQRVLQLPADKLLPEAYLFEINTMYQSICMLASQYSIE